MALEELYSVLKGEVGEAPFVIKPVKGIHP